MAPASHTSKWSSSTPSLGFPFHGSNLGTLWIHFWSYPPERFESSPCYQTWHATSTGKTNCPLPTALAASPTFSFSSPAMAPASHTSKWSSSTPSLGFPFHGSNLGTLWIHFWSYPPERFESSPCYQTWHATNTGKTVLSFANSIGSFTNFQLLVSCNGPSIPHLKIEVLLPHLWVSLFMAQTGEPFEFISDFIHRKDLKVHPVAKLGMPPTQGKQHCPLPTTLAASPTFSFSSPAIAPHHKPQNEVVLPHFWVFPFRGSNLGTLWIHSWFYPPEKFESSPCYQTWPATNTGKTNCPLPSALGEKTEKDRCWPGTFFFISGTCGCWLGTLSILFLEPLDFIFANPSVGWQMIFSLRNMWGWTPQISFLQFGFSSLGTYDFIYISQRSYTWVHHKGIFKNGLSDEQPWTSWGALFSSSMPPTPSELSSHDHLSKIVCLEV